MKNLLIKEFKLTCAPITYLFIAFTLMVFIPGYPVLVSAFFISMGIFYTFQFAREHNDVLYTALLPVKKSDVVKAKFLFVCALQLLTVIIFAALTAIKIAFMSNFTPYLPENSPLAVANIAFIGYVLVAYSLFNAVFLLSYFKTAYKIGPPFVLFIVAVFIFIGVTEVLHNIPALAFLNFTDSYSLIKQLVVLGIGIVLYPLVTFISYKRSVKYFDKIDI